MKKISVITVNYNNKIGLLKTIDSVLGQESDKFEYIIIDGGSTDGSVALLEENTDKITYWISEKDGGIYNAMNKGITKATGDYIIFLNSGDMFIDQRIISKCYHMVMESDQVDILYGDIFVVNQLNNVDHFRYHPEKLTLRFFKNDTINHQATLIRRPLFKEFGLYPEKYKLASDFWLYIVCLLASKQYKHLGFPMVIYDLTGISSLNGFKEYKIEQNKIWEDMVPKYVQGLVGEIEQAEIKIVHYSHLVNYKIVKIAVGMNKIFQKLRNRLLD